MNREFAIWTRLAVAACSILVGLSPALALHVEPLVLDMVSVGTHARDVIQIINDSAKPLPVEVVVKKLDIDANGKTVQTPTDNDFLVFPPQATVPPGKTQSFRVQWVGEPNLKKSQSYIIYVNQLPVKLKGDDNGVQMVFNLGVITNVAPAGARSALKIVSAEAATEGGKHGAAVTVENSSAMYSYLSDGKLTLESGNWRKVISGLELKDLVGYGLVLPGKTRRFFVAADLPAGASGVSANLDYTPKIAK